MAKITPEEIAFARECLETALASGAAQVRVALSKSTSDTVALLNGATDRIEHSADRSVYIHLFVDGRYGTCSTNRFDSESAGELIRGAIATTRLLAPDEFRRLPSPDLCVKSAMTGTELGLYDEDYEKVDAQQRKSIALSGSIFGRQQPSQDWSVISEEIEYTDNLDDDYLIDSQGLEARQTETSFVISSEVTVQARDGRKYSGNRWEGSPRLAELKEYAAACPTDALKAAAAQIGPKGTRSGKKTVIVGNRVASRLVSPIINALIAQSIQQKNSFLIGCEGRKVFSEKFTLLDSALRAGSSGARLFDTEGVATKDRTVIGNGVVNTIFTDSYTAAKTGWAQTVEGPSVPIVAKTTDKVLDDFVRSCRSGLLVTGFNGGNCNPVTGDFSYGVEGFIVSRGKISHPVREIVMTGNIIDLWNHLEDAGSDLRECSRWKMPSLVFSDVSINA